ncbi:MAG: ROK family protein [Candidatus Zixiibacteriota bacterium]|nr:MAG: ROK family protein [candidate division Zixibacteria bacterium]
MKKVYAGIDLGGSYIKAGLLTAGGKRVSSFKILSEAGSGPKTVAKNLLLAAEKLVFLAGKNKTKLCGFGVGSPGTIRYPDGIVTGSSPNIPGWVGTNIGGLFGSRGLEVKVDNDANCMALGEYLFGAGRGTKSGFYLTIGTGIGCAFINNGRLMRGSNYAAGEFGHIVLKYNGKRCKCGRRGCVEAYTAVPALIHSTKNILKKYDKSPLKKNLNDLAPMTIFEAFKKGDKAATEAISLNAKMLGTAIGSVVNLLNPEIVVIGGGLAQAGKKYIDKIRKIIFEFAFDSAAENLRIISAQLGNNAGWIGAACMNFDKNSG